MTKKDFELIAGAVRDIYWRAVNDNGMDEDQAEEPRELAAYALADALATTNPRFDRARFLAACGVQE